MGEKAGEPDLGRFRYWHGCVVHVSSCVAIWIFTYLPYPIAENYAPAFSKFHCSYVFHLESDYHSSSLNVHVVGSLLADLFHPTDILL